MESTEINATTFVGFRIIGDTLDPSVITADFGIHPTSSHAPGEAIPGPARGTYRTGSWMLDSGLDESASIADHLRHLLTLLEPAVDRILRRAYTPGWTCSFYCSVFASKMESDLKGHFLSVPSSEMARMAKLGADLD